LGSSTFPLLATVIRASRVTGAASLARVHRPDAVAADVRGVNVCGMYIADTQNNRILKRAASAAVPSTGDRFDNGGCASRGA
jgi:hypothetical protein